MYLCGLKAAHGLIINYNTNAQNLAGFSIFIIRACDAKDKDYCLATNDNFGGNPARFLKYEINT